MNTSMDIEAIPTTYNGCRFRSRLEARWALYFDLVGITWQYELKCFKIGDVFYLPDFYFPKSDLWLEVKRRDDTRLTKPQVLSESRSARIIIVRGDPQDHDVYAPLTCWNLAASSRLAKSNRSRLIECECGGLVVCDEAMDVEDDEESVRSLGIVIVANVAPHTEACRPPNSACSVGSVVRQSIARKFRFEE